MPKGIDFLEVQRTLFETEGVIKVHNLRIWSLSLDKIALAAHLAIGNWMSKYICVQKLKITFSDKNQLEKTFLKTFYPKTFLKKFFFQKKLEKISLEILFSVENSS